jgi:hypothetical protein
MDSSRRDRIGMGPLVAAILCAAITVGCPGTAPGQGIGLYLDLSKPLDDDSGSPDDEFVADAGTWFGIDIYLRDRAGDGTEGNAWLSARVQSATVAYSGTNRYDVDYSAFSLQFGYGATVFRRAWIRLVLGGAVGPVFYSSDTGYPCGGIFCDLPDVNVMWTPEMRVAIPVGNSMSAFGSVRSNFYNGGREKSFPFDAGVIASIGFTVGARSEAPDDDAPQP